MSSSSEPEKMVYKNLENKKSRAWHLKYGHAKKFYKQTLNFQPNSNQTVTYNVCTIFENWYILMYLNGL